MKLIGVPSGSKCQAFLVPATVDSLPIRGFLFDDGSGLGSFITNQPQITLPLLNPAVSSAHPATGTWKYLIIGGGSDPSPWLMMAAPTAGSYIVQTENGVFKLVEAGSIPGLDAVGASAVFVPKAHVLGLVEVSPGEFAARKIAVQHQRVLVGDVDGGGIAGYKALGVGEQLAHPIGNLNQFFCRTFTTLDGSGNAIPDGLELAATFGVGAIGDLRRINYSPANKRFFLAPARTLTTLSVSSASASTSPPVSYDLMPGGHCAPAAVTLNSPNVRIEAQISFTATETMGLGLFRDGVLIEERIVTVTNDPYVYFIESAAPLGSHTYSIRWKRITGSTATIISRSVMSITTLD